GGGGAGRAVSSRVLNVTVTKVVALSVPGSTPKVAVKYQTKLLWTLTDVPGF
ncbi:WxL domain-containing protein, partial [Enterococcus faecalis]|uniref:WxL domain-containing protein n=1 Tax=Enterococcus faecalis TaxID=1351 RepID=UPI003CC68356